MKPQNDTFKFRFALFVSIADLLGRCRLGVFALGFLVFSAGAARAQPRMKMENEKTYSVLLFDLLEAAPALEGRPVQWDMSGSIGRQYNRIWIKSEGGLSTSQPAGEVEFQALYSRLIAPFWEVQAGLRYDYGYDGGETITRGQLVLGLEGLAPYWFELEPALFISQAGDVSASLTGTYDLFVTQRLLLQPRLDLAAAAQEVEVWGTGSGLNSVGLGLRLRYEIKREVAPYIGIQWNRLTGGTAKQARRGGADAGALSFVAGVRWWH